MALQSLNTNESNIGNNDNKFINIIDNNILNIKTVINNDYINNYNDSLSFKVIIYDTINKIYLNDKTIDILVTTRKLIYIK